MGLSAVSLRPHNARTTTATKSRPHRPSIFRLCTSRSAVTPTNLRRLRDLPAIDLLEHLAQQCAPARADELDDLVTHIASRNELLRNVVAAALTPPLAPPAATSHHADAPRDRLPRTWVLSVLLRHGPPPLREAIAADASLITAFADVFRAAPTKLDPALAAHAADILRALLHEFPKQTATALHRTKLVSHLVQHVNLQPAADLLPRFVGTRIFTSGQSPILATHKRAIHMMASSRVHHLLLARFEHSVQVLKADKHPNRVYAAACVEGVCNAMAAISMRAMCIPRKLEDSDERGDIKYSSGLGLITASMYNDAKDYLNLLHCTQPLQQLLSVAFEPAARQLPEVFFATMTLLCSLLRAMRKKKSSLFPSMRKAVAKVDTNHIADVLLHTVPALAHLLHCSDADAVLVGRVRLAVVDLLREACVTVNEEALSRVLSADDYVLPRRMLTLARTFSRNEMVVTRVSQAFGALFSRCKQLGPQLLEHTQLFDVIVQLRLLPASWSMLRSFVCCEVFEHAMQRSKHDSARHDMLLELEEFYDEHIKTMEETGLEKVSDLKQSKLGVRSGGMEIDVDALYGHSEDFGLEVYIRSLLQEVSGAKDRTPPSDNVVQHAAEAVHHVAGAVADKLSKGFLHLHDDDSNDGDEE
ncbi:unnamed protein product [Agarophyton chilense]